MHELCVGLGFCGSVVDGKPRHVTDYIPDEGIVTADQFVDWLLVAEGFDPYERSSEVKCWKLELKSVFIRHMKSETVDAKEIFQKDGQWLWR